MVRLADGTCHILLPFVGHGIGKTIQPHFHENECVVTEHTNTDNIPFLIIRLIHPKQILS